jgi:uncharacterized protein
MLVIFQNKIIYMPGLPPNARWEKIQDYAPQCAGIQWREERIRAADGKDLALCVTDLDVGRADEAPLHGSRFYVLYFQGSQDLSPFLLKWAGPQGKELMPPQ